MQENTRTFFRPSVVIFVGDTGQKILQLLDLNKLLAYLDPVLRQGIGLIEYPIGLNEARGWRASQTRQEERSTGALDKVVRDIADAVSQQERTDDIVVAGYNVATIPLALIVGQADDYDLRNVLHAVREQLQQLDLSSQVCYVLHRYPSYPRGTVATTRTSTIDPSLKETASFCYLYEDIKMYPTPNTVTLTQSYYAAAEAVFSLIATGISSQFIYTDQMQYMAHLRGYEQVGNLSTSMVLFPRDDIRSYCGARLGVELLDQWLEEINQSDVSPGEQERQTAWAQGAVNELEQWIKDSEVRPGTEEMRRGRRGENGRIEQRFELWPDLKKVPQAFSEGNASARQALVSSYRRVERQSQQLFGWFTLESMRKEYQASGSQAGIWAKIAYERSATALSSYTDWDGQATEAWREASQLACSAIRRIVDRTWSSSNNGLKLAGIYVDAYDDKLKELARSLSAWRRAHRERYQSELSRFERLSDGEWVQTGGIRGGGNQQTSGQARPSAFSVPGGAGSSPGSQAPAGGTGGNRSGGMQQTQTLISGHQHLTDTEDRIATQLGQRVTWEETRLPSRMNLAAIGLFAAPALALLLLTIFSALDASLLMTVGAIVGLVLLIAIGSVIFYYWRRRGVVKARKDLLSFLCCYYTYRCEQREDQLRRLVMGPLRRRVQAMRDRLDAVNQFIQQVRDNLNKMANEAQEALFDSPAARCDVFVANGAPLQRAGPGATNTLEDVAKAIHQMRTDNPRAEGHYPAETRTTFLQTLRTKPEPGFIEMSMDEMQQWVYTFACNIIDAYLVDKIADVGLALELERTWYELFGRIRPVYRVSTGMREPDLTFICGRWKDIRKGDEYIKTMLREATPVYTDASHDPEWLLVAGLFRDQSPPSLDLAMLFPDKK